MAWRVVGTMLAIEPKHTDNLKAFFSVVCVCVGLENVWFCFSSFRWCLGSNQAKVSVTLQLERFSRSSMLCGGYL